MLSARKGGFHPQWQLTMIFYGVLVVIPQIPLVAVDGEPELIDHSPYYDQDQLINILTEKQNSFNIFSMNCQSLNSKVDELRILFHELENSNCFFDAICLQETWLDENSDTSLLAIEGYNLISQGKLCSAHSDLVIYLHNSHKYKILSLYKCNCMGWSIH